MFGWLRTNKQLRKEIAAQTLTIEGLQRSNAQYADTLNLATRQREYWRERANASARIIHMLYAGYVESSEGGLISRPYTHNEIKNLITEHLKDK